MIGTFSAKFKCAAAKIVIGPSFVTLSAKTILLILLAAFLSTGILRIESATQAVPQSSTVPIIPIQTDDGQDPVTLIFTGYAPSWWVSSNLLGWSDSAYCSGPKTLGGQPYNYTLEHPDPTGIPCIGPRDHIRIWDMGYSPIFGVWSVASAHHEYTSYNPLPPHHVIDSWERAEADARSSFLGGQATLSVSNYTIQNRGYYQGVYNDGNATMIQLKPPSGNYPVIFSEDGLGNQTSWSVTLDGATMTSPRPDIVFAKLNGTYSFAIGVPPGFNASPSSGTIIMNGLPTSERIHFRTPWTTSTATVNSSGRNVAIEFNGNATIAISTVQLASGGNTNIRFNATEIGAKGAINATIPKSVTPSDASAIVTVDGARDYSTTLTSDGSNYYVYFLLPYGTHVVQLQFAPPPVPYLDYLVGGAMAASVIVVLFVIFKVERRRTHSQANISFEPTDKFHNIDWANDQPTSRQWRQQQLHDTWTLPNLW